MKNANAAVQNDKISFAYLYSKFGILSILIVTIIISAFLSDKFLTVSNFMNIIRQVSAVGIVACGAQMILLTGNVDLSPGSVMALGGCICVQVMVKTNNIAFGMIVGILTGFILGAVNGLVTTRCRVPSFIITLAMQQIARGFALIVTNGYAVSIPGDLRKQFTWLGQGYIFGTVPVPIVILIIVFVITWLILNHLRFGRYLYAVGDNASAAIAAGINNRNVIVTAFVTQGVLAGLAGVLLMSRLNSGLPNAAEGYEFDAITAVIVGGTSMSGGVGNIYGTMIGALFVGSITNIMNLINVSSYWQQIVQGLIIALAVIMDERVRSGMKKN